MGETRHQYDAISQVNKHDIPQSKIFTSFPFNRGLPSGKRTRQAIIFGSRNVVWWTLRSVPESASIPFSLEGQIDTATRSGITHLMNLWLLQTMQDHDNAGQCRIQHHAARERFALVSVCLSIEVVPELNAAMLSCSPIPTRTELNVKNFSQMTSPRPTSLPLSYL